MSSFEEEMKKAAEALSDDVKEIVKTVLVAEHKLRFGERKDLPREFARAALQIAIDRDSGAKK